MKAGEISFTKGSVREMKSVLEDMAGDHIAEASSFYGTFRYEPNIYMYEQLDGLGSLQIYLAKVGKKVVGYSVYFLSRHHQFHSTLHGLNDILYVKPSARGFWVLEFIKWCEFELVQLGADVIWAQHANKKDLSILFKRLGYSLGDMRYYKIIPKGA